MGAFSTPTGWNGPNVNLKFEKDLAHQIPDSYGVSYINLGSCDLLQTQSLGNASIQMGVQRRNLMVN